MPYGLKKKRALISCGLKLRKFKARESNSNLLKCTQLEPKAQEQEELAMQGHGTLEMVKMQTLIRNKRAGKTLDQELSKWLGKAEKKQGFQRIKAIIGP